MSLGRLGQSFEANERLQYAMISYGERISVLTPPFVQMPEAFAQLVWALASDYLRVAEATSIC